MVPTIIVLCNSVYATQWSGEFAPALKIQKFQGDKVRKGIALKTRFTTIQSSNTYGFQALIDWEAHPLAPVMVLGVCYRLGGNLFFEPGAGVFIGQLTGQGLGYAITGVIGYKLTGNFYFSIPIIYRSDLSIWRIRYMPYIGYRF